MKRESKQNDEPAAMDNERGILATSFILLILSSTLRHYGLSVAIGKTKGVMFSLFFVFMSFKSEAFNSFGQFENFLILRGDTLPMNAYPLDHLPNAKNELGNRLGLREKPDGLKCYSALKYYWEIQDDRLFLVKVKSDCYVDKEIKGTLELIFGKYYREGKVAADWYSGSVYGLTGPTSYPSPSREPIYRNEWECVISKGKFIEQRLLDNSKARTSIYASKPWLVPDIIYPQIDWSEVGDIPKKYSRVLVTFSANENGVIDSVKVMKGLHPAADAEAVRIVKLIPDWFVVFRHGKYHRISCTIGIDFSEETRRKYQK